MATIVLNSVPVFSLIMAALFIAFGALTFTGRKYQRFLTVRYFTRRFLTYIAIILIASATWLLVVAPSIMNGFSAEFRAKVRGTLSDLMVWGPRPFSLPNPTSYSHIKSEAERRAVQQGLLDETYRLFRASEGVAEISPYVENPALYKHFSRIDYCFVRGCDPRLEAKVSQFESYILSPREAFETLYEEHLRDPDPEIRETYNSLAEKQSTEVQTDLIYKAMVDGIPGDDPMTGESFGKLPGVLVGIYFLKSFDLGVGDVIELSTASDSEELSENNRFVVVGAFRSGFYEQDRRKLYMGLEAAQRFIKIENRVTGISIKCDEEHEAKEVRRSIGQMVGQLIDDGKFPRHSPARTWEEKDQTLLQAVAMEKLLIRMLMSCLVLVAEATIFVVLLMSVREKARDLGVLKALGGSTAGIFRIYIAQGVLMSLTGVILGLIFGFFVSFYINEIADAIHAVTGWHPFPPDVYYLDRIPSRIEPAEIMQTVGATTLFAIALAAIPGLWASQLDPVEAVRFE